jgi:hypothetical protein
MKHAPPWSPSTARDELRAALCRRLEADRGEADPEVVALRRALAEDRAGDTPTALRDFLGASGVRDHGLVALVQLQDAW